MKHITQIAHRVDDYVCMWNGVEDIYIRDTGEALPPKFFFVLSSFGGFCYMKTPKSELKRMVAFGDGRTGKMYEFLSPIVGFDYKIIFEGLQISGGKNRIFCRTATVHVCAHER